MTKTRIFVLSLLLGPVTALLAASPASAQVVIDMPPPPPPPPAAPTTAPSDEARPAAEEEAPDVGAVAIARFAQRSGTRDVYLADGSDRFSRSYRRSYYDDDWYGSPYYRGAPFYGYWGGFTWGGHHHGGNGGNGGNGGGTNLEFGSRGFRPALQVPLRTHHYHSLRGPGKPTAR